ncbi:hypothetical protein V6Z12_A09G081700 [Gossypium hirsutum]
MHSMRKVCVSFLQVPLTWMYGGARRQSCVRIPRVYFRSFWHFQAAEILFRCIGPRVWAIGIGFEGLFNWVMGYFSLMDFYCIVFYFSFGFCKWTLAL